MLFGKYFVPTQKFTRAKQLPMLSGTCDNTDMEIFILQNFRVITFKYKYFRGLGYPRRFYQLYVPSFGDLEQDHAHQENIEYKHFAAFVATTQLLVNYSHARNN